MSFFDFFRVLAHFLRGRVRLYQCYTNVNWRTCERCLAWHGRIVANPQAFPARDDCVHEVLPFPVWKLSEYRERAKRMRARAEEELQRRVLWQQGAELLPSQPREALAKFAQAAAVDLHIPELEALVARHGPWLREHPEIRAALRDLLLRAWKAKFAKERYERQPEKARLDQEKWGLARIQELLA